MAIDKIIPVRIDRSADFKRIPSTSMVDALNVLITENEGLGIDYGIHSSGSATSDGGGLDGGNLGVLKSVPGNVAMAYEREVDAIEPGHAKIIGSVTDTKLKILYFFVWHEMQSEHGVWAYDPQHKLPDSTVTDAAIRKIHKSKFYNFPENGFVKGDIIYTSQSRLDENDKSTSEFDKDAILYFTDNTNEPRKLNAFMALMGVNDEYNDSDSIDFITACPKTPLAPITFTFSEDSSRGVSNFKSGPGFQFAYQYVYKDGVETAISPYSDIAFAPVILAQGTQTTINHNINNVCELYIPTPGSGGVSDTQTPGEEIKSVKILARQFNDQDIVILEEVDWEPALSNPNWDPDTGVYRFYNDRIVRGVSTNEFNKQFDNIPRKAQAQAIVDNRLMYGNYLEGFNNVETDATFNITYRDKAEGSEGIDYVVKVRPAISEQPNAYENSYGEGATRPNYDTVNKSAAYLLSASQLPNQVEAGTQIDVVLQVSPNYNFHIYQATDSYHQSRHRGVAWSGDDEWAENQINYDWQNENSDGSNWQTFNEEYGGGNYGHQSRGESGAVFCEEETIYSSTGSQQQGITFAGNNYGVSGAQEQNGAAVVDPSNANVGGPSYTFNSPRWKTVLGPSSGETREVCYGTSAGNPLIIKGGQPLEFKCSFTINQTITEGGGTDIIDIIYNLLTRSESASTSAPTNYTVNNIENSFDLIVDLEGLNNFATFPSRNHEYSKLVSGVVEKQNINNYDAYQPPIGYFIVKKAKVKFVFERDNYFSSIDYRPMLRLSISRITDVETATVVRKRYPESPWICLTKEYLQAGDFSNFIQETNTGYEGRLMSDVFNVGFELHTSAWWALNEEVYLIPPDAEPGDTVDTYPDLISQHQMPGEPFDMTRDFGSLNNFDQYQFQNPNPENDAGNQSLDFEADNSSIIHNAPIIPGLTGTVSEGLDSFENCDQILKQKIFLGYLDFQQSTTTNGLQPGGEIAEEIIINEFFRFDRELWEGTFNNPNSTTYNNEVFPFSLLDGESGPGGHLTHNLAGGTDNIPQTSSIPRRYSFNSLGGQMVDLPFNDAGTSTVYAHIYLQGPEYSGSINSTYKDSPSYADPLNQQPTIDQPDEGTGYNRSFLPLMQGAKLVGLNPADNGGINEFPYTSPIGNVGVEQFNINFLQYHPHVEVNAFLFSYLDSGIVGEGSDAYRTFKSSANHDFGVIYYDERGRHGFVNPLGTVYVPGYSEAERGGPNFGASEITVNLLHQPPEWAHYYKIAYTKNTSVQNFIQYSAGGAFIEPDTGGDPEQRVKIYVSLNYLQEHPISYVASWGARDPEGGISMFKYISGGNQKVRIISYEDDAEQRQYPNKYEFDIVDTVLLGAVDNPLFEGSETDVTNPEKTGEFLILRDNIEALGFNFAELTTGNESGYWDNNCIIEIFTPMKGMEEDNRFYYEIGDTYDVLNPGEINRSHSVSEILIPGGDVWWRRVPVNTRNAGQGVYPDLIAVDSNDEDISESRFKAYYLETEAASDLFKADATFIGRPNIALKDAVETVREASITYSQQSNPNSRKINYSSFNRTLSNFKELQEEFGDINYMCNLAGDVFVIQSDKCTLVPASKTLFSDISGTDVVAASKSPLGQEKIFAGRAGCDNNPESVAQVGSYIYFAHKRLGKVFRFNPSSGIQELSDQGLGAYFRSLFRKALEMSEDVNYEDVRVVGGFNPLQQEYLLTVLYPRDTSPITVTEPEDPYEDYVGGDVMGDTAEIVSVVHFGFDQPNYDNPTDVIVDSPFNIPIDFGGIPRTTAGTEASQTFVITNSGTVDVIVDLRETNENKFHNNDLTANSAELGRYWNPSIVNIVNEAGVVQLNGGGGGIEDGTVIPAGMSHTFTINLNVNKANHGGLNANYWGTGAGIMPNGVDTNEQYLLDTYGTLHRALTGPERQSINTGTSSEPEYNLNPYYNFEFTFDVYDSNTFELLNPQVGSPNTAQTYWPFWVQQVQYTVTELEGDEDYDGPTILGDLNGDGVVGVQDLLTLLSQYGSTGENLSGDLNNDGAVTVGDLLTLLNNIGQNISIDDIIDVPPLNIVEFGNTLIDQLESTYGLDTSEATTYEELMVIDDIVTMQILEQNYPDVYNFINEGDSAYTDIPPLTILQQVYLYDNDGNPIIIE